MDALSSLLTLLIMLIGLALIIGGPRAVRFIFAPFIQLIRRALVLLFMALIILVLVAAVVRK